MALRKIREINGFVYLHIVGSILFQKIKAISSNEIDKKRETTQSDILISRLSNDDRDY